MSNIKKPLVLITGATGYLGGHILEHLVESGYAVRATTRPAKFDSFSLKVGGKADVVPIADLATSDYSEALKGVSAVIHVAAPVFKESNPTQMTYEATEGTMNIVRQALAAKVTRVIVTSSVATALDPNHPEEQYSGRVLTDKDWNPLRLEDALVGEHPIFWVYSVAKVTAERELWKFADAHPEIDITTIHPSYVYGPFVPGTKIARGDIVSLSTVAHFWQNVLPEGGSSVTIDRVVQPIVALTVDVRDVARVHVRALTAPLSKVVGRKRLFLTGPSLTWIDAVVHLREAMPELKDRLPTVAEGAAEKEQLQVFTVDMTRTEEVLGKIEFINWRKTAEDTAKTILEIEKSWEA